jgi:transposase, IS5 family
LLLLKHIFALSDEEVCESWVYDPISSTSPARSFFQHALPHERSDLSHWKKRLGEKLELLLAESLRVAHEAGALRTRDLKRVTVDTPCSPRHHVSDRRQVAACPRSGGSIASPAGTE